MCRRALSRFPPRFRRGLHRVLFLRVAFMIECKQPVEYVVPRRFGDGVADAVFGLVETVVEVEIGPTVSDSDCVVQLDVQRAQGGDVLGDFVLRVEAVVDRGESLTAGGHEFTAV